MAPSARARAGMMGEQDWTEDFPYENGKYSCTCAVCGAHFIGHKRRVVCRQCANVQDDPGFQDLIASGGLVEAMQHGGNGDE